MKQILNSRIFRFREINIYRYCENLLIRIFLDFKWRLFLIWPITIIFAYICFFSDCYFIYKKPNEIIALIILVCAVMVFLCRVYINKNPLETILLVLSAGFLCRELHFTGTTSGIYISLAIIAVWGIVWRNKISETFFNSPSKSYLIFTLLTYLLSQMIARRVFKGITVRTNTRTV